MAFTNLTNIPLPVAVWLAAAGDYDFDPKPNQISATSLQKPIRSIVLEKRVVQQAEIDIESLIPSKLGTAIHTAVEVAWITRYRQAMHDLGLPKEVIEKTIVNPKINQPNKIFVWVEKRTEKEFNGYTISGKFDIVIDGELHDIKTTKTYNYIEGSNDQDYTLQGSIYRWLNQDIITKDYLTINYVFMDWSPLKALADKKYPQARSLAKKFPLLSVQETEQYVSERLAAIQKNMDLPQEQLPKCTKEELWQEEPVWAYYSDPNKKSKSTKNFNNPQEAYARLAKDNNKGIIILREGEVKRCNYCNALSICQQAEQLRLANLLKG